MSKKRSDELACAAMGLSTPKPKAEETLKACPMMARCVGSSDMSIIEKCPLRRTPAKDEGEGVHSRVWLTCPDCHEDHVYTYRTNDSVKCVGCGFVWKPTAPADDGEETDWAEAFRNAIKTAEKLMEDKADLQAALAEKEAQVKELRNEWGNEFECREAAEKRYQTEWNACANFRNELAEKDKRIEELEEQRSVSLKQINTLGAKLKSAEAVVEAARPLQKYILLSDAYSYDESLAIHDQQRALETALSAHDKGEQEPEEQHFIEEGLSERCKKV